jgi:aquaporin Z
MSNSLTKPLLAEFLGTFTLVFVGTCAVVLAAQFGVLVPAFAHGLAVLTGAFIFGGISGGHFNPAVTLAMLVTGKIALPKALAYIVVQVVAAIVAAALTGFFTGGFGPTLGSISPTAEFAKVAAFEAVLTFFLVSTIFQAAVHGRAGNLAPVAIGFTLVMCILAGGPFTGASLNPARTLGPAIASGDLSYILPYLIGPVLGAVLAAVLHTRLLKD